MNTFLQIANGIGVMISIYYLNSLQGIEWTIIWAVLGGANLWALIQGGESG